jgi:3-methyladenine DNA glycosylase/8-oxoguanine DNA glycosylase
MMSVGVAETWIPPEAAEHLRQSDPVLGTVIDRVGPLSFRVDPDLWRALVGSIVGQQLSVAAARTIRGRIAALGSGGFPTPAELLEQTEEVLRGKGLSRAKALYVRDIAQAVITGEMDPVKVASLADEDVIAELIKLRGVGRWTAEMVLIFSLGRENVLAVDDLGIRVAAQRLYGLEERPGGDRLLALGESWKPYRSYASLYLWRSLDR